MTSIRPSYLGRLCKRAHADPSDPTKSKRYASGGCIACQDYISGAGDRRARKAAALDALEAYKAVKANAKADRERLRQALELRAYARTLAVHLPAAQQALHFLNYDPQTGALTKKTTGAPAGKQSSKGFLRVTILGTQHAAHRLIYGMVMGWKPVRDVVALDGNIFNLKWSNLHQETEEESLTFWRWHMQLVRRINPKVKTAEPELPLPVYRQTPEEVAAGIRYNQENGAPKDPDDDDDDDDLY